MSPAIPVWIGSRRYPRKLDAEDACRTVIAKYPGNGEGVGPMSAQGHPQLVDDPEDIAFLQDLVKLHPEPDRVIGAGVKHFAVRVNGDGWNGQRCFWVWREDGSADDFSWPECLKNAPTQAPTD
ncbi:DCL family protein [Streptomyces zaomyceticus]|uniref:DCL family protein n=1 Tax=Streptomyces zaomyceticus TaxID=68286 RepID=UPI002E24618E